MKAEFITYPYMYTFPPELYMFHSAAISNMYMFFFYYTVEKCVVYTDMIHAQREGVLHPSGVSR